MKSLPSLANRGLQKYRFLDLDIGTSINVSQARQVSGWIWSYSRLYKLFVWTEVRMVKMILMMFNTQSIVKFIFGPRNKSDSDQNPQHFMLDNTINSKHNKVLPINNNQVLKCQKLHFTQWLIHIQQQQQNINSKKEFKYFPRVHQNKHIKIISTNQEPQIQEQDTMHQCLITSKGWLLWHTLLYGWRGFCEKMKVSKACCPPWQNTPLPPTNAPCCVPLPTLLALFISNKISTHWVW